MKTTKWYALLTLVALAALLVGGIGAGRAAANPGSGSRVADSVRPAGCCVVFGTDLQADTDNPTRPHNNPNLASNPFDPLNWGIVDYDDATDNSTFAGHSATTDGGLTWFGGNFPPYPGGVTPLFYVNGYYDAAGNWIVTNTAYNQTNNCGGGSGIYVNRSTDNGATWASVLAAPNTSSPYVLNYDGNTTDAFYGTLRKYQVTSAQSSMSICGGVDLGTLILLRRSDDGGVTWSMPVRVNDDAYTDNRHPSVKVSSNGNVIVSFYHRVGGVTTYWGARSTDGGVSFQPNFPMFPPNLSGYPDPNGSGDQLIKGDASHQLALPLDGELETHQVNGDAPATANYLYTVWTDHLNDGSYVFTDTQNMTHTVPAADIAFSRSSDGGASWSTPIRVNDDPQGGIVHDQFLPAMTVGNDGVIHIAWLDRRDDPNNINYNVYYAQSTDNGLSFSANQLVSDVPSNPSNYIWSDGYIHLGTNSGIAVNYDNSTVMVAWTDQRTNGQQHVYVDRGTLPNPHTPTPAPPTNTPGGPTDTPVPTDTPAPTNTTVPPTPQPTVCPNPFVDIVNNIFFHAINYLYCNHVVNGTDATHYSPAGISTRGQFAKVVALGFGLPSYTPSGGAQDFSDVPSNNFAYQYIESGFHAGILSGFDQAGCTAHNATYPCYLPNIPITRGQLTKLVVGAAHYPLFTPTGGTQTFSDVPPSNIFFAFIETAHNKGVINGYPDGTFRPNNNIRRDEMAQIVYKGVTTP